jgi:uncharacterized membrane protein
MLLSKKRLHIFFEAGIFIKAITSTVEIVLGILFLSLSTQTVNRVISFIFGDELTEQPRDPIWSFFLHNFSVVTVSIQHFWAIIFIAHGVAILFLIMGLVKKALWIYPTAAIIFTCLVVYQIYHIIFAPSALLSLLTAFDVLFIWLVIQEYQYQKYEIV